MEHASAVAGARPDDVVLVALVGGRLTAGVMRCGDRVRYPWTNRSEMIIRALEGLTGAGFDESPEVVAYEPGDYLDVNYVAGDVPSRLQWFELGQVERASSMLRRLHDASSQAFGVEDGKVLCHGDSGPNNFVFRAGEPIALIDFADIRWGDPLDELAYFAWLWCVSAREFWPPVQSQADRIGSVLDAYGVASCDRRGFTQRILRAQNLNASSWLARLEAGTVGVEQADKMVEWSHLQRNFVDTHRAVFERTVG